MIFNIHTHTKRCHHAVGEDEEYVLKAINTNMKVLGFSDHIPYKHDPHVSTSRIRMSYEEIDEYLTSIHALKDKYKDQIDIYVGFESEFIPQEYDFYPEILKKVDYLILGPHLYHDYLHSSSKIETEQQMDEYVDMLEKAMQSHYFTYIAHPDIFLCNQKEITGHVVECIHKIAKLAVQYNVVLEYNIEGLRDSLNGRVWPNGLHDGYPRAEFWKIISTYPIKVIAGIDAHDPNSINDEICGIALNNIQKLNLNYIEQLDMKKVLK